jgi:hypothetical protein
MRDLFDDIKATTVLAPVATTTITNTAQVCNLVDSNGFESLTWLISTGTLSDTDATFTVLVEEGDTGTAGSTTLSDAATVSAAGSLLGTVSGANFTFAEDNKCIKIGYRGAKRYARLTITPANNSGNVPISVVALQGHPKSRPQASQQI